MKKVLLFVAVVAVAGLTSCKKDWACECTYSGVTTSTTEGYSKLTKKDAEAKCEGKVTVGLVTVNPGSNCTLRAK